MAGPTQTITNASGQTAVIATPVETVLVNGKLSPVPISSDAGSPTLIPQQPLATLPFGTPVYNTISDPISRGVNDITDIRPTSPTIYLPTRAEKRLLPTNVSAQDLQTLFNQTNNSNKVETNFVSNDDFFITAAKKTFTDFVTVKLPHRGINTTTLLPDTTQAAEYRFLINPQTFSINRQTVDTQSLTRGGWQFGVWGEDVFTVQMTGQSAGSYFTKGLTDEYSYYAISYRNLMQLQQLFENNGYWFEGEEYNEGPLAAGYLRRRIRVHQDVELHVENFIWFGMFDGLTIAQDAEHPFTLNFSLSFLVWKERFRSSSPYWGSITNDVQRGHSYSAVNGSNNQQQTNNALSQYSPSGIQFQLGQVASQTANALPTSAAATPPAVSSAIAESFSTFTPTTALDSLGVQPTACMMQPYTSSSVSFWNASLPKAGGH